MDVLKYLRDTQDLAITYGGRVSPAERNKLLVYADANFSKRPSIRKSRSGFVIFLNGGPVAWKSSLQTHTALSTTESELYAMFGAVKQSLWLKTFMSEVGFDQGPLSCFEDNSGLLAWIENPRMSSRMQHIELQYYWLRDTKTDGLCNFFHVETLLQRADLLTKQMDVGPIRPQLRMLFNSYLLA